jgi:hypothetical protein
VYPEGVAQAPAALGRDTNTNTNTTTPRPLPAAGLVLVAIQRRNPKGNAGSASGAQRGPPRLPTPKESQLPAQRDPPQLPDSLPLLSEDPLISHLPAPCSVSENPLFHLLSLPSSTRHTPEVVREARSLGVRRGGRGAGARGRLALAPGPGPGARLETAPFTSTAGKSKSKSKSKSGGRGSSTDRHRKGPRRHAPQHAAGRRRRPRSQATRKCDALGV